MRELMFRAALEDSSALGAEGWQIVRGFETVQTAVYKSDFRFLFLALEFPCFGALAVFVMMLGWWELGRKVSLSPVETAKAFGAPILEDAGSNQEVKKMLKRLKHLEVRYGDNGRNSLEIGPVEDIFEPKKGYKYE